MAQDPGGNLTFEVPGYQDVSQIGRGASSNVFKGYDPELSRWVAIKVLLTDDPEDPARRRFKREGEITANLGKHPHIVQVLGTGFTASGFPYVVMEYFEQGSIGDRLRISGTFTVDETLDIGEKIADAVSAAHRANVLHRDIKPQNVLLSEYGPALADFGIARSVANLEWSQSLDQLTPMHAPPEVLMGGATTVQSDIYSLGSTLYTMLSGRPPFAGPSGEAPLRYQVRVTQDPVPPIPRADIPTPVTEVLERALAKDPRERHGSAAELRDALRACQHRSPGLDGSAGAVAPVTRRLDGMLEDAAGTGDRTVTRAGDEVAEATAGGQRSPVKVPRTPRRRRASKALGLHGTPALSAAQQYAVSDAVTDPVRDVDLGRGVEPGSGSSGTDTEPRSLDPGTEELTIQRPGSASKELVTRETSDDGSRRRRALLLMGGVAVLLIAVVTGLVLTHKPATPKIPVKKVYTITTTATEKPANLSLTAAGTGATLQWSDPEAGQSQFLVYEISAQGSKIIGVTPAGKTTFALSGLDPSTTHDCFEVRARISKDTVGAPAQWCPSGESLSGG